MIEPLRQLNKYKEEIPFLVHVEWEGETQIFNFSAPHSLVETLEKENWQGTEHPHPSVIHLIQHHVEGFCYSLLITRKRVGRLDSLVELFYAEAQISALKTLSQTDGMTRLHNKTAFVRKLQDLAKFTPQFQESCTTFSRVSHHHLIIFDIDHFKRFNDDFGHLTGDRVIKMVALVLRQVATSHQGFAARYGGEEFALLLPGDANAQQVSEELRCKIMDLIPVDKSGNAIRRITVSLGWTSFSPDSEYQGYAYCDRIIERADMALYVCKKRGRNRSFAYAQIRAEEGKIIELIGSNHCLLSLGSLHGVAAGDRFTVIHHQLNGVSQITDPVSGLPLGKSPKIIKGIIEVIPPGLISEGKIDHSLSLARVESLFHQFQLEAGDLLCPIDTTRLRPEEFYEFNCAVGQGGFTSETEILSHIEENQGMIVSMCIEKLEERLINEGKEEVQRIIQSINKGLNNLKELRGKILACSTKRFFLYFKDWTEESRQSLCQLAQKEQLLGVCLPASLADTNILMILRYISPFILEKERIVDWHSKYLLPLAHFLLKTEKLSELEWLVTQFSQEQNNSAAGWNLKGGLHWGQGNLEEALFCYKSGTEVDSLSIKNWMNLGVLYRLTGNLENSLKAFEQCYILHPEIPQVINNLAEALLSVEGDSERMLKLIQQAIEKANNTQVLLYRRTEFQIRLHRKEFSEAEILIYKLLQEDKTIVHFLKDLYNDLSNNGKQHQAAFCKKILTESMI